MAYYATVQDYLDAFGDHGFTDQTTARQIEVLNDAWYDVLSRNPWPFLEKQTTGATVAGNKSFTNQPTDMQAVLSMVIDSTNNVQVITPIRLDDLTKRYAGALTQTGTPYYYYFIGEQLNFYPVPDAVYTITVSYIQTPTPLAAAGDATTLIPQRHRRVVLLGALASLYDMEDDSDLAVRFEGRYEARIQKMWNDLSMKQYDRPDTMADLFRFDDIWD